MMRVVCLVALLAAAAVLSAESFDSGETPETQSKLDQTAYPEELAHDSATDEDFAQDTATDGESKDFPSEDDFIEGENTEDVDENSQDFPSEDDFVDGENTEDVHETSQGKDISLRSASQCNGRSYNVKYYRCCYGRIIRRCYPCFPLRPCGPKLKFNPYTQGCCYNSNAKPSTYAVYYRLTRQCCYGGLISSRSRCSPRARCGAVTYNPLTQSCCYGRPISNTQRCLPRCGLFTYIPPTQRCCGNRTRYHIYYQRCCSGGRVVSRCSACPRG